MSARKTPIVNALEAHQQSLAALRRHTDRALDRTAARWFVAGLAVGLLLAWAVWPVAGG